MTGCAPVVKVHTKGADNPLPAVFLAPALMVAVYVVLGARNPVGVKVAVAPVHATVPVTGPAVEVTVKVPVVKVEQFNADVVLSES